MQLLQFPIILFALSTGSLLLSSVLKKAGFTGQTLYRASYILEVTGIFFLLFGIFHIAFLHLFR